MLETARKKWARLDYFNVCPESNGLVTMSRAGSIAVALVLGTAPEGGQQQQQQQRADLHMAKSPRRPVPGSEEMQNKLSPQLQLELQHLKTTSAASLTKIYFLN